eukprot:IDg3682t1
MRRFLDTVSGSVLRAQSIIAKYQRSAAVCTDVQNFYQYGLALSMYASSACTADAAICESQRKCGGEKIGNGTRGSSMALGVSRTYVAGVAVMRTRCWIVQTAFRFSTARDWQSDDDRQPSDLRIDTQLWSTHSHVRAVVEAQAVGAVHTRCINTCLQSPYVLIHPTAPTHYHRHHLPYESAMAPPRAALAAAPLLIALLLASPACARSASGKFVLALKGNEVKPVPVESGFLNDESNIFAFEARTGLLTAELHAISSQRTDRDKSRCFKLALCDVTPMLARDNSFRSRPLYLSSTKLREQAAENVCGTFQRQETEIVCSSRNFSTRVRSALPELKRGRVFFVALFACPPCLIPNWPGDPSRLLVNYTINMRNTRAARPGLGWDEDVYRFAPAIVATLAMAVLVSIVGFAVVAFMRGARVPIVIAVLGVAAAVKCVIAIVTAVVYVRIAKTGSPLPGF